MNYEYLTKNEAGNIVDSLGNTYSIKPAIFTAGYDALFLDKTNTQLDFWHELPKRVQDLFK